MKRRLLTLLVIGCIACSETAHAGSIAVSPVTLDLVTAGDAASSITVTNSSATPVNVQVRVQRWTQIDGKDQLDTTDDVVVSPAIIEIKPHADQVIRIVRIAKRPVVGEEAYRLLVDELPGSVRASTSNVNLVVRQSLPVFFRSPQAALAPLAFELSRNGNATTAVGINRGDIHQKITALTIKDAHGAVKFTKSGLVGYVLGKSSFAWKTPMMDAGMASIQGRTEHSPINLPVPLK